MVGSGGAKRPGNSGFSNVSPALKWQISPIGTTRLEFVTSGRSVAISSLAVGQPSAFASTAQRTANADTAQIWKICTFTETLIS
jgi:hypothetical protein